MLENIKRNEKRLLIFLIFYRTINSLLLLTMFEPDEFFQNIEPITFLLTKKNELSWDFLCGIRSINFSLLYYLPLFIGYKLNSITLTYLLVKFMNGILSGLNDFFTIKIGNFYHTDVFFITLIHHGLWLYSPRSHINSFEMLICTSTMYFLQSFKRHNQKKEIFTNFYYLRLFLYFTLIGSFLRPSACLMSLLPFLQCVIKNNLFYKLFSFVPELILLLSALIFNDYLFYKEVVLVPFNFVKYNVFYKVQELFGVLPFYIYFPFGLVLLGPSFFYFFLHFKKNVLSLSVLFFFTFYSSLSHKEMRFLIPMIPFVNILVSKNKKLKYYFYYPAFIIGIIAGLFHQNIFSTLYLLKREIDSCDEQKNILFLTEPYIFPSFILLSVKKVSVKLLSGNPNIFEKISDPKIYKRFNQQLVVKENYKVIDQIVRNEFLFDEFNLLVLSNFFYDLVKENISDEFMLLGVKKYYLVDLPGLPNNKFYIFKRIK